MGCNRLQAADPMTSNQYRAALAKLGLSQLAAARLLQADGRTSRRWALGERSIPPTVAVLLRLLLKGKVTAADIENAR